MILNSNTLTFVDVTDTKKIDVHISSNKPTTQIYDVNKMTFTPSWKKTDSNEPLQLDTVVYADSLEVTDLATIKWFKNNTNGQHIETGSQLIISDNVLDDATSIVEYICQATYNEVKYENKITFTLITTGKNGLDGQPGKDGLDGKDGTSVHIEGTAYAKATPVTGSTIDLYSDVATTKPITGTTTGESYLVDGYLCVYNTTDKKFICTGKIQGPKGAQGDSSYLFVRYAEDQSGKNMVSSPTEKTTYIGFYRTSVNEAPTNPSLITWTRFIGTPASLVTITPSALYFKSTEGKNGIFTPEFIYLYPRFQTVTYAVWQYSTDGGITWSNASGANGLTISTYNSVTNTLRISGTSTLYTDTITSISFRCLSSNNAIYDTVSVAKIYDVVDLKIGGRNLARFTDSENWMNYRSATLSFSEGTRSKRIRAVCNTTDTATGAVFGIQQSVPSQLMKLKSGQEYTLSFLVRGNIPNLNYTYLMNAGTSNQNIQGIDIKSISETNFTKITKTFVANDYADLSTGSYLMISSIGPTDTSLWFEIEEVQLEAGQVATDWSPSPEDILDSAANVNVMLSNEAHFFEADSKGIPTATSLVLDVVGFKGSIQSPTKIGTITGLPSAGMTAIISDDDTTNTKITIAVTTALTSSIADYGTLTIPITVNGHTVNKMFSWSKAKAGATGATGVGIQSTTVSYGVSDSASTKPADSAWQSTIPVVAEGKYLWTRTIIDYTNNTDTVTYTYAKQGVKGDTGSSGTSVTVSNIQYQAGASATTAPTSNWSNSVVAVTEGNYLWTKTTFSDGKIAYGVAKQGISGRGISGITEYYLATTASSGVTTATSGWTPTVQSVTSTKRYLWNYEAITYTDDTVVVTTPVIIGVFGNTGATGKGIKSVTEYYLATSSSNGVKTSDTGWTTTMQTLTATNKYLWNYEIITYTDGTTSTINPVIIGVYGDKGDDGVGINSITVDYGVSDAATVKPTTWQQTIPTVAEGKYLWTRTVTDYTDTSKADTVTYVYTKQGSKGDTGTAGTSVTVKSIKYQSGTSATTVPTGTWSDNVVAVAEGNYLWTQTTFSDNKVAYGVAKQGQKGDQGVQGPKGNDAYTVMLTNESHIFAGDVSNALAGSATTQILAYNGSTAQTVTIVSVNNKTATTTDTDTGITGLKFKCSALSGTSPTITLTCTTSFVSKSGSIPIVLSVGGVQFTKIFTYSIAFKGATGAQGGTGTPASLVDITPSALYFKSTTGKGGTFTPDYIYLYPRFQTVAYSKWEYSTNGGTSWTTVVSGSNGLTIGTYNSVAYSLQIAKSSALYTDTVTSISFRCVSSNAAVYDTVSIAKIYDVVDLQIGGRNYIQNSSQEFTKEIGVAQAEYLSLPFDLTPIYETYGLDQTYTLSFDLKSKNTTKNNKISVYPEPGAPPVSKYLFPSTSFTVTTEYKRYSITFKPTRSTSENATMSRISVYGTYDTGNIPVIKNLKLEAGNKATDWSPAPEDLKSTTFQLYAPKGYLITNETPEVTLQTFAYDGSQQITNATFAWYTWNGEAWIALSGATGTSLVLNKSNVFKSSIYKCDMTYGGKVYTATATVEDKTDLYDSLIHITSKYSPSNRLYWVLYSTVYSEEGEKDELLGPVSVIAPTSPVTGAYWYKIDETNYTVTLMKYSGTAWVATTDKQEFVYDWFMLNDTNSIVTLGERSKVKIVTSDNFSRTCSIQCNVLDQELAALTHSNQVINDPSDPIVSDTEPTNPVNGQLWIKTNANGLYMLLVWDASNSKWVVSEADTQKKVYVQKPTAYNEGDIWIVAAEYEPDAYVDGILQKETIEGVTKVVKHIAGTMLMAQYASQTYKDSDWIDALKYTKALDKVNKQMDIYNQFFTFDNTGMTMKAKSLNGQISEFSTKLTNTELGFYQGENKVAYINNNQLNISKAEITNGMKISGTEPMLQIGNFVIMQESNGSLSIGLKS